MKRFLLIFLAAAMLLCCACGNQGDVVETDVLTEAEEVTESETVPADTAAQESETAPAETEAQPIGEPFQKPVISDAQKSKYYGHMSDKWKSKIEEINNTQNGRFTFLVQSDTHMYVETGTQTANNAKALSHYAELDFIASLGDLIRGYAYEEDRRGNAYECLEELTIRYTENVNCPVLMTFGNHDTNAMWCKEYGTAEQQINQLDHYFLVTEKLKQINGSRMVLDEYCNYYYMDFPEDGIRVVMLNSTDGGMYLDDFDKLTAFSDKQLEWFENKALNTDLSVIVMTHVPLSTEFPENGSAPTGSKTVLDAVEKFVVEGGDFIAYMYGHVHEQYNMVDKNGRLHISFNNGGGNGEIIFVDTVEKSLETIGLGNSVSRNFTYGN